ncbi:MAG: FAD-dependent oxidoreductase [Dehalococcoidia bacterium]|nr:MAG: FAD-dependent oxidoreductase [Dehalococcoidia bacterium]
MTAKAKPRLLVLGGGFGGLESAFYLRWRLGDRADITLVSEQEHFVYKPNTIYIPFGLDPKKLRIDLSRPTKRQGIEFVQGRVQEIDPTAKSVRVDKQGLTYDFLVVATGADMRPAEVPGLVENGLSVWTEQDMLKLREAFEKLASSAGPGERKRVIFLLPPNNKCSGPLYEIVLMLETWLKRKKVREHVDIIWTTFEKGYIQVFGPRLHEVIGGEFDRRGIEGRTEHVVSEVEPGQITYENGERLAYDFLISFPPYVAGTRYSALPADDRGFLRTVFETRQVVEHPEVYAVGDTADFPVKQAFEAFLQADTAAEHLATEVLGKSGAKPFDPTSMCVMDMLDKATFAQVPLRLTGRPELPVEVRPEDIGRYKVGTSAAWRVGKKILALYLPYRFKRGKPFHAGAPWRVMEAGLKLMSRVLAK